MATNLNLDEKLIADAMNLGGHKTKRAAIIAALDYYVKAKRRSGIVDLIGKVDFHRDYNHQAASRGVTGM